MVLTLYKIEYITSGNRDEASRIHANLLDAGEELKTLATFEFSERTQRENPITLDHIICLRQETPAANSPIEVRPLEGTKIKGVEWGKDEESKQKATKGKYGFSEDHKQYYISLKTETRTFVIYPEPLPHQSNHK